jgi:hypothetical protein
MSVATAMHAHGSTVTHSPIPSPSALTTLLSTQSTFTHPPPTIALPLEILHNLRHQHFWTEIYLHHFMPASSKPSQQPDPVPRESLEPSISELDLTTHLKAVLRPGDHANNPPLILQPTNIPNHPPQPCSPASFLKPFTSTPTCSANSSKPTSQNPLFSPNENGCSPLVSVQNGP